MSSIGYRFLIDCPIKVRLCFKLFKSRGKPIPKFYSTSPKIMAVKLLFPGQGSQYVGLTKRLQPLCPRAKEIFDTASTVLGYDLEHLCLNGPDDQLQDTVYCQPAVVVSSLVALEQMKHNDPQMMSLCVAMAGFSVGEITALIASKAIALEKGLELVKLRATLMQRACEETSSGMLTIIGLEEEIVSDICREAEKETAGGVASIANHIFPNGFVVSANKTALDIVCMKATEMNALSVKTVHVSGGFHSQLMSLALPKLRESLEAAEVHIPTVPVYSNVTGAPYHNVDDIKEFLVQQVVKPVLWMQCINHMIVNFGVKDFIEVGPGKQLKAMLRRTNREAYHSCINMEA